MALVEFTFRPLAEDDIPLMHDWLNRPHMARWWHGAKTIQEVREKYLPRIAGNGSAVPYLACVDGEPLGYIQYYIAVEGDPRWWPDTPGPGVWGIDTFLADGERLNQGLGTSMVSQFVAFLFRSPDVTEIRVDPAPDNARAIRCYEKAGFRRVGDITTPDGPAVWMVCKRESGPTS